MTIVFCLCVLFQWCFPLIESSKTMLFTKKLSLFTNPRKESKTEIATRSFFLEVSEKGAWALFSGVFLLLLLL